MEPPVLTDKSTFPSETIIFSHLGKSKVLWLSLFDRMHSEHPDFSEEWRYYNDGKCWLMKVVRKKKTVFWLTVIPKTFRVTFYFTDKANALIAGSTIPAELKIQFSEGRQYGKIRGLTVVCKTKKDIAAVEELMAIKCILK
jgi:hypothetical protein